MLDQSFSYDNLKEVYDYERRKGHSIDELFSSAADIEKANTKIKDIYRKIKTEKQKFSKTAKKKLTDKQKEVINAKIDTFEADLTKAKEEKKNFLKKEIEEISDQLNSPSFSIVIKKVHNFLDKKKPLYSIQKDLKGLLFKKHIQRQLNNLYKIKQSNRYLIVEQLFEVLQSKTIAFNVIKFDIESFYESIDLDFLKNKLLVDDNLLSPKIKKHITSILDQYKALSKSNTGVPRGIGLSAYLSELYMRDFDRDMRNDNEVFFYARYVDDIVLVTAKDSSLNTDKIAEKLNEINLSLKPTKTFNLRKTKVKENKFDYLGYSFTFENKGNSKTEKLMLDISDKRFERYKKKIDTAFEVYDKTKSYGRKAAKYLFLRIKFLVSNVRLTGEKDNILSGIYYSNKLVQDPIKFKDLDKHLKLKVKSLTSISLKNNLKILSFEKSFRLEERNFFYLKKNKVGQNKESKELERLLKIWNYVK